MQNQFTQADLARLCHISQRTLSDIETGQTATPNWNDVNAIAHALGVTMLELTGEPNVEDLKILENCPMVAREASAKYNKETTFSLEQFIDLALRYKNFPEQRASIELGIRSAWPNKADDIMKWIAKSAKKK